MSARPWRTKMGKDCVSLDGSLCRWLGDRLIFLSQNGSGMPVRFMHIDGNKGIDDDVLIIMWKQEMAQNGQALLDYSKRYEIDDLALEEEVIEGAKRALIWVADWLPHLWD